MDSNFCVIHGRLKDSVYSRVVHRDCERIQIYMLFTDGEESVQSGLQRL